MSGSLFLSFSAEAVDRERTSVQQDLNMWEDAAIQVALDGANVTLPKGHVEDALRAEMLPGNKHARFWLAFFTAGQADLDVQKKALEVFKHVVKTYEDCVANDNVDAHGRFQSLVTGLLNDDFPSPTSSLDLK